jgi:hypothetical protein
MSTSKLDCEASLLGTAEDGKPVCQVYVAHELRVLPPAVAIDCLHGSRRSVGVLMSTFSFVAAAALTLIILSLHSLPIESPSLTMVVSPPSSGTFGVALQTFAARLTKGQTPIEGVQVVAKVRPIEPMQLEATLNSNDDPVTVRTVKCLDDLYGLDPLYLSQNSGLCGEQNVYNNVIFTDGDGFATFANMYVTNGAPQSYALTVSVGAPYNLDIQQVITFAGPLPTLRMESPAVTNPSGTVITATVYVTWLTSASVVNGDGSTGSSSAGASSSFASPSEGESGSAGFFPPAPNSSESGSAASLESESRRRFATQQKPNPSSSSAGFSSSSDSFTFSLADVFGPGFRGLEVTAIPLDLSRQPVYLGTFTDERPSFPSLYQLSNVTATLTLINITEQYITTAANISVVVESSSAHTASIGVFFLGSVMPLTQFLQNGTNPKFVVVTSDIETSVETVTLTSTQTSILETTPLTVNVKVTSFSAARVQGIYFFATPVVATYAYSGASPNVTLPRQQAFSSLRGSPALFPKVLLTPFLLTDASGTITGGELLFGVEGGVGRYNVFAVCMGIVSAPIVVDINSSVVAKRSRLFATYAPWVTTSAKLNTTGQNSTFIEKIGMPFATVPRLFVRNASGGAVCHKFVSASCPTLPQLVVPDTFTNTDGIAIITGMYIASLPQTTPTVQGHNITFFVDGMIMGYLEVLVDSSYDIFAENQATSCVVELLTNSANSSAVFAVANKILAFQYAVRDIQGFPLAFQAVTFSTVYTAISSVAGSSPPVAQSQLVELLTAEASSTIQLTSDVNGIIDFSSLQIAPTPDHVLSSTDKKNTFLTISASCVANSFVTNSPTYVAAVPLYNPVRDIVVVNSNYGSLTANADIDWGLQGSSPVTVTWAITMQDSRLNIFGTDFSGQATAVFPAGCSDTHNVSIVLDIPSYVEGDLLLTSGSFRTFNNIIEVTVPRTVGTVEIVRDMAVSGLGVPSTLPIVRVLDVHGQVLPLAAVAIQMLQGNRPLAFSAKDLATGFVFPYYTFTGADGLANFTASDVSVLGFPNNEEFSFQFVSGLTAARSLRTFTLQTNLAVQPCDSDAIAAAPYVPGEELPPICVSIQSLPNSSTIVPVSAQMESKKFGFATLTPPYLQCFVEPHGTSVSCNESFTLSGTTPPDTYMLTLTVPGSSSEPVPVTVSWSPLSLIVVDQPPQNVLVGSVVSVVTRALNGNVPVPSTVVSVRLVPVSGKCNKKFPFSCGSLLGSTFAVTDSGGYANFSVTIPQGAEGMYKLSFLVAGQGASALQGAIASAESISQTFLGPFFDRLAGSTLPNWVQKISVLSKSLPSSLKEKLDMLLSGISASSVPFKLWNPVARILIASRPAFQVPTSELPAGFHVPPVLRLIDRTGSFVPNVPVDVITSAPGDCFFTPSSVTTVFSDPSGYVYFSNLAVAAGSKPGKYFLAFVAYGVTNFSASGSVTVGKVPPPSMSEEMRIMCFVLVVVLSPLIIANMPYSSALWIPFSLLILGGLAVGVYIEAKPLLENPSIYEETYAGFVVALWLLMVASVLFLGLLRVMRLLGTGRVINREATLPIGAVTALHEDEYRMAHGFAYTRWLITARRSPADTMEKYKAELNEQIDKGLISRLKRSKSSWIRSAVASFTVNHYTANTEVAMKPLQVPADIVPVFIPVRYWIAMAILFVIYVVAVLFSVYVEQLLYKELGVVLENMNFEAVVPMPRGLTNVTGAIIAGTATAAEGSHDFSEPLIEAIKFAASIDQRVHFISRLLPLISPTLFQYITMMYNALLQVRNALIGAFITAHIVAGLAIAAAVFFMTRTIQRCMMSVRRGEYRRLPGLIPALGGEAVVTKKFTINLADDYIGLQVIVYIVQHQLAFWFTVLIYLVIACDFTRSFLISKLLAVVSLSLVISILRGIVTKTLVKKFAANGITVVNNLVYGVWSVFSTVIGTIAAAIATVTRLAKGFGLVIFLFPRIDHGLLPADFALLDQGFLIFWSMIIADHAHTSPILLSVAAVLVADSRLRRLSAAGDRGGGKKGPELLDQPNEQLCINRESLSEITRMPNLNNMVRQRLTFLLRQSVAYRRRFSTGERILPLTTADILTLTVPVSDVIQIRYFRTARRWWLLFLLHQNPSLRAMRKHRLRQQDAAIMAENALPPPSRVSSVYEREMSVSERRLNSEQ